MFKSVRKKNPLVVGDIGLVLAMIKIIQEFEVLSLCLPGLCLVFIL